MKKIYALGAVAMALLTTGCSNDQSFSEMTDNLGKDKIQLSAGDDQVLTAKAGFTVQTRIVARIVSNKRGGGTARSIKTVLLASAEESAGTFSKVSYAENKTRYWDDAYGRNSILSVYAVAIPNVNDGSDDTNLPVTILQGNDASGTWPEDATPDNTMVWAVKTNQAYADLAAEDLTYSNNIQAGNVGGNSVYTWSYTNSSYPTEDPANATKHTISAAKDGRLYFTQSSDESQLSSAAIEGTPGHFDKGQMEFRHALTRIQVNILKGEGYDALTGTDAIVLKSQPYKGTFNIESAEWTSPTTGDITMAKWASPAASKIETNEAQVLPGYTFATDGENAMIITVGANTYYITNAMLHSALSTHGNYTTERGNRYIFDITVKKNEITNITATVVPWNEVTADGISVDNSHYKFQFYKNGANVTTDVNLYKYEQTLTSIATGGDYSAPAVPSSTDPAKTYSAVAGFGLVDGKTYFTTSEYYKDNKTAYHFRSLNGVAQSALNAGDGKVSFTMTSGAASTSNDYLWGAPLKKTVSTANLPYSSTQGYLNSIEKGIVAANTDLEENYINLTQVHMMSQLVIKLTSVSTDPNATVNLTGASVKITQFSKTGTVNMGSGLITPATPCGDMDDFVPVTTVDGVTSCTINVVPQDLVRGKGDYDTDYVGITIHTADNNEYYIVKRLSEIIATSVGSEITNMQQAGAGKYITTWYPGHKYVYTFNITKTEIKNITATIVDWNTVTAGNTDLDLEK